MDLGYFSIEELRCHETKTLPSDSILDSDEFTLFVTILNEMRGQTPLLVSSWYRSPLHSVERAKLHPGVHTTGLAADLVVQGQRAIDVCAWFLRVHKDVAGLGVSQKGSTRFIHCDLGGTEIVRKTLNPAPPRPTIWSY